MLIIRDFDTCPSGAKGAVIALGNFDGVHLGHRAILRACAETAHAAGVKAAVMTFEPHPREFFGRARNDASALRIVCFHRKMELLKESGIDVVFLVRFNAAFANLSAEAFVQDVLCRRLQVRHVVTGYNFAFGKGRSGTTDFLMKQGALQEFGFTAVPPVHQPMQQEGAGRVVSSSAIRQLLASGHMQEAAAMLGRPYEVEGFVRHGNKRGRVLGFPTANLCMRNLFHPRFGVYAVRIRTGGDWHDGVANLGVRPMFLSPEPLLEVHGFDMDKNLYGKRLLVEFVRFIREERRYEDVDALKIQMGRDCQQAREALSVRS